MTTSIMQIVFKDLDENLIMSRKSSAEWYFDKKMVEGFLEQDAKQKGVRIIKTDYSKAVIGYQNAGGTIQCIVDYLGRKK